MKTLNGLRLQPLTSEHYCPWAADEDDVFDSVAHLASPSHASVPTITLPAERRSAEALCLGPTTTHLRGVAALARARRFREKWRRERQQEEESS
jgi:hypothetical protein